MKRTILSLSLILLNLSFSTAQTYTHYTTTEGSEWQQLKATLSGKAAAEPVLTITGSEQGCCNPIRSIAT